MDIVDAQVHVFYTLPMNETLAVMNALGIQSVVIDEFWAYEPANKAAIPYSALPGGVKRPVSPLAQAATLLHPERFSYLQRVERKDPQLAELFAILGSSPGCRSIRVDVRAKAERAALAANDYDDVLRHAQRQDLVVSVLARETGTAMRGVLERFPEVRFVLDHCGSPQSMSEWDEVLALGRFRNCWLKWCHGHHFFDAGPYPYAGLQEQLARALSQLPITLGDY